MARGSRKIQGRLDPSSKMEPKVLEWIKQTRLWEQARGDITLHLQYPVWEYITEEIPKKYITDFCIIYEGINGLCVKIIIEYDGWGHFTHTKYKVDKYNWHRSYSYDDMQREYIIERSGYEVLRINKWNRGNYPVEALDNRMYKIIGKRKREMRAREMRAEIDAINFTEMPREQRYKDDVNTTEVPRERRYKKDKATNTIDKRVLHPIIFWLLTAIPFYGLLAFFFVRQSSRSRIGEITILGIQIDRSRAIKVGVAIAIISFTIVMIISTLTQPAP